MSGRSGRSIRSEWADRIEALGWGALILDRDWTLEWVSTELRAFIVDDDEALGVGSHVAHAFTKDAWISTLEPDDLVPIARQLGPYIMHKLREQSLGPRDVLPEFFVPILEDIDPAPIPSVWTWSFRYRNPRYSELPPYRVDACALRIADGDGHEAGWVMIYFMGVRPNLLTLLALGDQDMYQRMADLVEPATQQAAILMCDVHESGLLARSLSSGAYFKLVRTLWTEIDDGIASRSGIVGKHAGDGASAFFLVRHLGSASSAASAALDVARRIHEIADDVSRKTPDVRCLIRVGVHWGSALYMGQLVPGNRLEVTALGDEVNETARLQECATPGTTLASKQLVQQMMPEDSRALGVDLEQIRFTALADLPGAPDKCIRDAGGIPVVAMT